MQITSLCYYALLHKGSQLVYSKKLNGKELFQLLSLIHLTNPWVLLTHWGQDKMAAIFHMTFWNGFFFNENVSIFIKIPIKFVSKVPINNITALIQVVACHWPGDRQLSEPIMFSLLMHNTVETLYSTIYYSKYFIELNFDKSTQYVALWTHKRHPIPRPFGRAMECLLWVLEQKLIVL